jgi:hypothetical protein
MRRSDDQWIEGEPYINIYHKKGWRGVKIFYNSELSLKFLKLVL